MPIEDRLCQGSVATIGGYNPIFPIESLPIRAKARKRSPHQGVVLIKPHGRYVSWRARYAEPDTGKTKYESLDANALRTAEARRDWAIRKAKALAQRRLELEGGAAKKTGTPVAEGMDLFFEARKGLRAATLEGYRKRANEFIEWGTDANVLTLDHINRTRLLEFRDFVHGAENSRTKDGGARSDFTNNRILRETSVLLHWLLERNKLPCCSADDLKVGLRRVRTSIDRIDFLNRGEPQALLRAAIEHDCANKVGYKSLHEPVAPFILALLLTGMRFTECLELRWGNVNLKALGHEGEAVGEAYLSSHNVKTKQGRVVSFDVSPSLRSMLEAMPKDTDRVFHWLGRPMLEAARKRLKASGAPSYSWQGLRRTTGSYLTNAPGIFGSASAFHSAKRLGHSVSVSEKHYLGTVKGIPHTAKTIEAAMDIEAEAEQIVELVRQRLGGQHD
jgi:integrase